MTKDEELFIESNIAWWENIGAIDPQCATCKEIIYPRLWEGKNLSDILMKYNQSNNI